MASSLFGNNGPLNTMPQMGGGMFDQIRQFSALIGNRNPQQMVMNLMKQRGIPMEQLNATMQEARTIARQMGMK